MFHLAVSREVPLNSSDHISSVPGGVPEISSLSGILVGPLPVPHAVSEITNTLIANKNKNDWIFRNFIAAPNFIRVRLAI